MHVKNVLGYSYVHQMFVACCYKSCIMIKTTKTHPIAPGKR